LGVALLASAAVWACVAEPDADPAVSAASASIAGAADEAGAALVDVSRQPLGGGLAHYRVRLRVGDGPNAELALHRVVAERAPWRPRAVPKAVMLLHGDFSSFASNFLPAVASPPSDAPGLARYLAGRGLDVWGVDRRWTQAPADGADLSDFADMGLAQELADIDTALTAARALRLADGSGGGRMALAGFSRGGQLAYLFASQDAARPAWRRQIKALVPIDVYAEIAPLDEDLRLTACASRDFERQLLSDGVVDSENSFIIGVGQLALTDPDGASPYFPDATNRQALLTSVAQTYLFVPFTPLYHLAAGLFDEAGQVTGLTQSSESRIGAWWAAATPHQSMREFAESDAMWCGEPPLPVDAPLSRIKVPVYYLGAAGGFGDHGLYSTTRVASTDVTTLVVRRFAVEREAEDFGHADLLFATDAPALAWAPLVTWLLAH
jgi:hypothetical protein